MSADAPIRTVGLADLYQRAGARFCVESGWRVPAWFAAEPGAGERAMVGRECMAIRRGLGIIDMASVSKFDIKGPEAVSFLDRVCCTAVPERGGQVRAAMMLSEDGKLVGQMRLLRIGADHFRVIAPTGWDQRYEAWFARHAQGRVGVRIRNITEAYGVLLAAGARAPEFMRTVSVEGLSDEVASGAVVAPVTLFGVRAHALTLSSVCEAAWAFYHRVEDQRALYEALKEAARPFAPADIGRLAFNCLRIENGYRLWGADTTPALTPFEACVDSRIAWNKPAFIGRDAVLAARATPPDRRLMLTRVTATEEAGPAAGDRVLAGDQEVGEVTSTGWGYAVGFLLAWVVVRSDAAAPGTALRLVSGGRGYDAVVLADAPYGSNRARGG